MMSWWTDFVQVGEALMEADPEMLSQSVRKEVTEKYLNQYETIHKLGQVTYKLIGALSAKKYQTGRLA